MAGRARGIGTHGQRPAEKAGNRGASNYCFGWFHVLILFVCDWCLVASAPGLRWGRRSNSTISHLCATAFIQEAERVLLYSRKPRNASLFEAFVAEQTSMGRSSGTDHIWNSRGPICRLLFGGSSSSQ